MKKLKCVFVILATFLLVHCSKDPDPAIKIVGLSRQSNLFLEKKINQLKTLSNESVIIQATEASNEKNFNLSDEEINSFDRNWMENNSESNPLIKELLSNDCANYLRDYQKTHPEVLEIFVMDSRGLIVGESNITSDYLQADEKKFSEVFRKYTFWHSGLEFDESSKTYGIQISVSIKDIGAICATLNLKNIKEH